MEKVADIKLVLICAGVSNIYITVDPIVVQYQTKNKCTILSLDEFPFSI